VKTGFVIVSTDEARLLEPALAAALDDGFDEALVVDNASTDETAEIARRREVELVALERRVPYVEAMNIGLRRLSADAIAFLQPDTFIERGYREACVRILAEDAGVGSVAPKLLRATGPSTDGRLALLDAAAMTFDRRRKNSLVGHGRPADEYARPGEAFGADGAAAFYRRVTLDECTIEGQVFDQGMPGWGCDADLAWRARLLGWRSRYEPAAVVHHVRTYSPTTRAQMSAADRRTQFRNRYLMMVKNDSLRGVLRDLGPLVAYEVLALGFALLREPGLLRGYVEAVKGMPHALRWRRSVQAMRREARMPFGLEPEA
jgi:GT2 family glycosyltransferase